MVRGRGVTDKYDPPQYSNKRFRDYYVIKFRDEIDPPDVTSYFVVTSEFLISQPDKT